MTAIDRIGRVQVRWGLRLIKLFGPVGWNTQLDTCYSRSECIGVKKIRVEGDPDMGKASTSSART